VQLQAAVNGSAVSVAVAPLDTGTVQLQNAVNGSAAQVTVASLDTPPFSPFDRRRLTAR
jgi:hypothetical protein